MNANLDHRIIVFGRDGLAREQLVIALSDNGVVPIWVGSPSQCSLEALSVLDPNQIVVSLEPIIETELEPFNDFLGQQSISVLYDDAESTKHLSGWDLNRWARHLASKLLNLDYMPPAPNQELHKNQQKNNDAFDSSSYDLQNINEFDLVEIDSAELNAALETINHKLSTSDTKVDMPEFDFGRSESSNAFEIMNDEYEFNDNSSLFSNDFSISNIDSDNSDSLSFDKLEQQVDEEDSQGYMDEEAFKLAVDHLDSQLSVSVPKAKFTSNFELQSDEQAPMVTESESKVLPVSREFDLSKFSLVTDQSENQSEEQSIELESDNHSDAYIRSVFLVISGIGGPGVVRSILGHIKSNFTGILVLSQAIEANQLPKLMQQLQKMISTPIVIPESEEYLMNGHIYLLPENHAIQLTSLGYQCVKNKSLADFLEQMDQNVEIVVLSGADVSLSQSLIQTNQLMNNIHIQPPEDCFDATLTQLLANIGAPAIRNEILATWFN